MKVPVYFLAIFYLAHCSRGLTPSSVEKKVLGWSSVLRDSQNGTSHRSLPTSFLVLGFVTPWNAKGVDVAIDATSRKKIDIVVPVEFQVTPDGVRGGLDFDSTFYEAIKSNNALTFPRFVFEGFSGREFLTLTKNSRELSGLADAVVRSAESKGSGGVVLEVWHTIVTPSMHVAENKAHALNVVETLGCRVRNAGLKSVLVLPPYTEDFAKVSGLSRVDFERLAQCYDYFVVMTYDFSGVHAGPQAPLPWVESVARYLVHAGLGKKLLLGLNFYGVDAPRRRAQGRNIQGHEFLSLLKTYESDVVWLSDFAEDAFSYELNNGEERLVFFPTKRSIAERIALAQAVGCGGIALWDLGQGLPWLLNPI